MTLTFRSDVTEDDVQRIGEMVTNAGVFSPEEIDVAIELAQDRLTCGSESPYNFLLADIDNVLAGYTCFGRIPLTAERYDLYWIVVEPAHQQKGIAGQLMRKTEEAVATLGGKAIYAETSSRAVYSPAQAFYQSHAFGELARLQNFYADGDDKIIFGKWL